MNSNKKYSYLFLFFLIFFLLSLVSANPELTILSVVTFIVVFLLLFRPGEPPVLFFIAFFQWIQSSIKVLYANIMGMTIEEFQMTSDYLRASGEDVESAIQLSLISIIFLTIGIWIIVRKIPTINKAKIYNEFYNLRTRNLLFVYFIALFVSVSLKGIIFFIPSLAQPLVVVVTIKWVVFYILTVNVLITKKQISIFIIIIFLEFILGVTGIFSDFKELFFYLILSFLTVKFKFKIKTIVTILLIGGVLFSFAVFWTGVKGEYRMFMTGYKRGNLNIVTTKEENLQKLYELSTNFTKAQFNVSVDALIDRVSYVDFFAFSLKNVPTTIPFENGNLWGDAIANILKPRMFFPDKKVLLSDSELTMKYTGLTLGSGSLGTSFSIGYIGESYIDFGKSFMYIPIFILGLYYGFIYKYFVVNSKYSFFGFAIAVTVILIAYRMEISSVKLIGLVTIHFLFYTIFKKFGEKIFCNLFLKK